MQYCCQGCHATLTISEKQDLTWWVAMLFDEKVLDDFFCYQLAGLGEAGVWIERTATLIEYDVISPVKAFRKRQWQGGRRLKRDTKSVWEIQGAGKCGEVVRA